MHGYTFHCLIVKGALIGAGVGDFGRKRNELYRDWASIFKKVEQVIAGMDESHYQVMNSGKKDEEEEEDEGNGDGDENDFSDAPKLGIDMSAYEFTNASDVFKV